MSTSLESFVNVLKRSGLVDEPVLAKSLTARQQQGTGATGENFAEFLVGSDIITSWQAAKLLQGKHKGFFLGKYKLLRLLGKGGMSSVYLAEHVLMRRRCAIKVLPWKLVKDSSYLQRFHREAQAVASLDHPNIVRAYDIDHEKDGNLEIHFLVMEYVEGRNLFDMVQSVGPLSAETAAEYIRQGALGLAHAHQAGMVHRDVKPGNFIVDQNGTVKLMDLGLARVSSPDEGDHSLTIAHDERVLGTADYLAPEQAVDSHQVDARADLYSLGCTMYFLLTGRPPFNEGTLTQRLMAHQTKEPTPIESLRPDVPESLLVILRKLMAKDREQRIQTADEAAGLLRQWLSTQTGSAISMDDPHAVHPAAIPRTHLPNPDAPSSTTRDDPTKKIQREAEPSLGDFLTSLSDIEPASGKQSSSLIQSAAKSAPKVSRSANQKRSATFDVPSVDLPRSGSPEKESISGFPPVSQGSGKRLIPADDEPSGSSIKKKQPPSPSAEMLQKFVQSKYLVPGAIGAVALLLVLGYLLFGGKKTPGRSPATPPTSPAAQAPAASSGSGNGSSRPAISGTSVSVGPQGNFATLAEAVQYIGDSAFSSSGTAIREIQIAGNQTLNETISIDKSGLGSFPRGVRIVGLSTNPPRLRSPDASPVISLNSVDVITLENLIIDCNAAAPAVKLQGFMASVNLKSLRFENIQNVAITGAGFSGLSDGPVLIENCTFQGSSDSAIGLQFEQGKGPDTRDIRVLNCRFLGPMQSGISVQGGAERLQFRQNIFHDTRTGIVFAGGDALQRHLSFVNNTFHQAQRGIHFETSLLPTDGNFQFQQNLFVQVTGPAVSGDGSKIDLDQLTKEAPPSKLNGTDHSTVDGEQEFNIFQNEGRLGVNVKFLSTSPADANFLKPDTTELSVPADQTSEPAKYIGAVAP